MYFHKRTILEDHRQVLVFIFRVTNTYPLLNPFRGLCKAICLELNLKIKDKALSDEILAEGIITNDNRKTQTQTEVIIIEKIHNWILVLINQSCKLRLHGRPLK